MTISFKMGLVSFSVVLLSHFKQRCCYILTLTFLLQITAACPEASTKDAKNMETKNSTHVDQQIRFLEKKLLKELADAELSKNSTSTRRSLLTIAKFYHERGNYNAAKEAYERVVTSSMSHSRSAMADTATALEGLAQLYRSKTLYDLADADFKRALEIKEQIYGPNDVRVGKALYQLALSYQLHGKYEPIQSLFRRSMTIMKRVLKDNPQQIDALSVLSYLYLITGKQQESEKCIRSALAAADQPNSDSRLMAVEILDQMAKRLSFQNEVESLYRRSLSILESTLGPNSPKISSVCNALGSYYLSKGNLDAAHQNYTMAISRSNGVLYPDSLDIAITLDGLAEIASKRGDSSSAVSLEKKALSIFEKFYPSDSNPLSVHYRTMANLYKMNGDLDKAKLSAARAQSIFLKTAPANALPYPPKYVLE